MKRYEPSALRNVGIFSPGGTGKTTLVEAMLFCGGVLNRMGSVSQGNTASDNTPAEIKRQGSAYATALYTEWNGHRVNLVDTPGYPDFVGEVIAAVRAVDAAVFVVSCTDDITPQHLRSWDRLAAAGLPTAVFLNKIDGEHADPDSAYARLLEAFGGGIPMPLFSVPAGKGGNEGIVNVIENKGRLDGKDVPVPASAEKRVTEAREKLAEAAAEGDDKLTEKYLESGHLAPEEIRAGLLGGVRFRRVVPVFFGSAEKNLGVDVLLDTIVGFFPSPLDIPARQAGGDKKIEPKTDAPLCAVVFKTVAEEHVGNLAVVRVFAGSLRAGQDIENVTQSSRERVGQMLFTAGRQRVETGEAVTGDIVAIPKLKDTRVWATLAGEKGAPAFPAPEYPESLCFASIHPATKKDQERMGTFLSSFSAADPTFKVTVNREFGETVVSGMGQMHLDAMMDRLREKGVSVTLAAPRIPYRESVKKSAEAEGKHKKQTGGHGQYGHVFIRMEPAARNSGFEFVDGIVGGRIPGRYIPSVEKGLREAINHGILAGYPVIDIRATVIDGSFHKVDSSDIAFQIAASLAFRAVMGEANPYILEPIQEIAVEVPETFMGDITGNLNSRRGRVLGVDAGKNRTQIIRALVPTAELQTYAADLQSMTRGAGTFTMKFDHYEEVPERVAQQIVAAAQGDKGKKEKEED